MAQRIVINVCFGGFSLSPLAVKRLAELKGRECYFFVRDLRSDLRGFDSYRSVKLENIAERDLFWAAFDIPNPEILSDGGKWNEMTSEERRAHNEKYSAHSLDSRPADRSDADLIRVIDELGKAADGGCAKLRIVEIPDGVDWQIDEYDGNESIAEKHRSWR